MKIDRLELPSGNGNFVEFGDPDNLRGRDYRRLRDCMTRSDAAGHTINSMMVVAAELLISAWQVDYLGAPMLPKTNPKVLDELTIRDTKAVDEALTDFVRIYVFQDLEKPQTEGDPQPPASE